MLLGNEANKEVLMKKSTKTFVDLLWKRNKPRTIKHQVTGQWSLASWGMATEEEEDERDNTPCVCQDG
jgi:hypothetical protein